MYRLSKEAPEFGSLGIAGVSKKIGAAGTPISSLLSPQIPMNPEFVNSWLGTVSEISFDALCQKTLSASLRTTTPTISADIAVLWRASRAPGRVEVFDRALGQVDGRIAAGVPDNVNEEVGTVGAGGIDALIDQPEAIG